MTLVIPPGYGSAAFIFSSDIGTPPLVTTIGVNLSAAGGDFVGAANSIMATYGAIFSPLTNNALTLDRVTLAVGDDGPGGSVDSDAPPIPMTSGATFGPVAQCVIARKITNTLGRRGRGRMFLPGTISGGNVDENGNLSAGIITSFTNALNGFVSGLQTGFAVEYATPPVLLHTVAPVTPTPIESMVPSSVLGWVRGRIR